MKQSDFKQKDLTSLIHEAQAEAEGRSTTTRAKNRPQRSSFWGRPLLVGCLCFLAVVCGFWFWSELKPASKEQVVHDLEQVLNQAREAVETFRASNGRLPTTLPNAALSSVVNYSPLRDDEYILEAGTKDVRLVLPSSQEKPSKAGGP